MPVSETKVIQFFPHLPGLERDGICWGSSVVDRPDAWRCATADQGLYDPCFAVSFIGPLDPPPAIVCGMNPLTQDPGFKVHLTQALPPRDSTPQPYTGLYVWFIELADGSACPAVFGATGVTPEGKRFGYHCSTDPTTGVRREVVGDLQSGTVWKAEIATFADSVILGYEWVDIRTVWR
jgi:hypothetical protein